MKLEKMKSLKGIAPIGAAVVFAAAACVCSWAQTAPPAGTARVYLTVTSTGNAAPRKLTAQDIRVYQDDQLRPVVRLVPVATQQSRLDVAIVVDDSLNREIANQFTEIKKFIHDLPANAEVEVVYASHGSAEIQQGFTTEREAAARALHMPAGSIAGADGLYDSLRNLAKHWPNDGAAGVVVLISDGVDVTFGTFESLPSMNTSLQRAIEAFQSAGITAYSIYASGSGRVGFAPFLVESGQGCLARLASETGGEAFFQGTHTPVDIGVFLDQIRQRLASQYVLEFRTQPGNKSAYSHLRVTTEQLGVKLSHPTAIFTGNGM